MYTHYSSLLDAEKGAHERAVHASKRLGGERDAAREEATAAQIELARAVRENSALKEDFRRVFEESGRMREECQALRREVQEAREEGKRLGLENMVMREEWGISRAVTRKLRTENERPVAGFEEQQGVGGNSDGGSGENERPSEYAGEVIDTVRHEFSRELEMRIVESAFY